MYYFSCPSCKSNTKFFKTRKGGRGPGLRFCFWAAYSHFSCT